MAISSPQKSKISRISCPSISAASQARMPTVLQTLPENHRLPYTKITFWVTKANWTNRNRMSMHGKRVYASWKFMRECSSWAVLKFPKRKMTFFSTCRLKTLGHCCWEKMRSIDQSPLVLISLRWTKGSWVRRTAQWVSLWTRVLGATTRLEI